MYLINARPCILMHFYPFSSQRKRSKNFLPTLAFSFCFHLLVSVNALSYKIEYFSAYSTLKHPKTLMETISISIFYLFYFPLTTHKDKTKKKTTVYEAFFVIFFKSIRFHLYTPETGRFKIDVVLKGSTYENVFESLHFQQRFRSFYCGR